MNKTLIFSFSLLIITSLIFADVTPQKAAGLMELSLKTVGVGCKVSAKTINNVTDFKFECTQWYQDKIAAISNEKEKLRRVEELYHFVVASVGDMTKRTSWKSDKAWIYVNNKAIAYFYTKDCRKALTLPKSQFADFVVKIKHSAR